jgi:hypothetical protein
MAVAKSMVARKEEPLLRLFCRNLSQSNTSLIQPQSETSIHAKTTRCFLIVDVHKNEVIRLSWICVVNNCYLGFLLKNKVKIYGCF